MPGCPPFSFSRLLSGAFSALAACLAGSRGTGAKPPVKYCEAPSSFSSVRSCTLYGTMCGGGDGSLYPPLFETGWNQLALFLRSRTKGEKGGGEWGKGAGGAIDKGGRESFHNPEVNEGGK